LRNIEAGTRQIGPTIYVDHAAYRTAVYSHPELQAWMLFERTTDLDGALCWCLGTRVKDKRHAVARWKFN
jgi:hypothetical protein